MNILYSKESSTVKRQLVKISEMSHNTLKKATQKYSLRAGIVMSLTSLLSMINCFPLIDLYENRIENISPFAEPSKARHKSCYAIEIMVADEDSNANVECRCMSPSMHAFLHPLMQSSVLKTTNS